MQKDGGVAFPRTPESLETGMSLRDYFAAAALPQIMAVQIVMAKDAGTQNMFLKDAEYYAAHCAYAIADAMLEERSK